MAYGLAALAALLLPAVGAVVALFAALAPEPYMDEPFHVPQTQRYCVGRWLEWDPKITTFPGLYIFGTALGRLVHAAQKFLFGSNPELCTTTVLRSVNLLFAAACLPIFHSLARRLDNRRSEGQLLLMTAACFLFPLHFFYYFMYYTDVPSLFFTLAAYLASLQRRFRLAAALGAAAVLMRQTNAVWVAFILGSAVIDRCLLGPAKSYDARSSRGGNSAIDSASPAEPSSRQRTSSTLLQQLVQVLRQAWLLKWKLLQDLWPLATVVVAFAAFVMLNGGIVVGDKSNHAPVKHLVQPLYFMLYCTAWLAPVFWTPAALGTAASRLLASVRQQPVQTSVLLGITCSTATAVVSRFTLAHPFLLADNRHYTFYLWRRLLNRTPWARFALIPAYLYSGWAMQRALARHQPLWVLLLAAATCIVLVPAHLVEFRYFTTPFYLFFVHMNTHTVRSLTATVALFAAVNAATLYLYLYRPFAWPDGSTARFIW